MTQSIQTLDSALQAIAAEREALKFGHAGSLAEVPTSSVPNVMPLPPIPRSPGLVNTLPTHLQSVTRVDVPYAQNQNFEPEKGRKGFSIFMLLGNAGLSLVVGIAAFYMMTMIGSGAGGQDGFEVLAKADFRAVGKQAKISAAESSQMNKSCTTIFQDGSGRTKSSSCHSGLSVASTTEITQYSAASTSATVNPNKFRESLSTSSDKIAGSLSAAESSDSFASSFGSAFSGGYTVETTGSGENDGGGTALKLKPRGIVKKFYTKN